MTGTQFEGQVALVTGGASGIGRATVLAIAAEGASVAIVDRDDTAAKEVVAEASGSGASARAFIVDLAEAATIAPLVAEILGEFGRIDILVNSAGLSGAPHSSVDFSDEVMELVLAVNLRAPLMLTRAVGTHMIERGGGGHIVNLSSSAAFRATSSPAIYAATKAGLNGLTRAAAADLGPHDINVNAVAPGLTRTPMTAGVDDETFDRAATVGPLANLLHRPSEADDVANVIVFLCRPESRQITGQVINTSAGLVV
jgi:NAD(P)-dependent dehydrogenase (short-subunit alcohol dehydrogenase family)